MHVCDKFCEQTYRQVADKTELIEQLKQNGEAVVVLDYTLFDINDIEELEILHERFPLAKWILFSFDLSPDFVRRAIALSPLLFNGHDRQVAHISSLRVSRADAKSLKNN